MAVSDGTSTGGWGMNRTEIMNMLDIQPSAGHGYLVARHPCTPMVFACSIHENGNDFETKT